MSYIGHNPTNAGSFYILDAITLGNSAGPYNLTVAGVSVTPKIDNLLIALDGVLQHAEDAYTISGNQITFDSAPGSGVDFYGVIMGQSASFAQGSIGADELKINGDGSSLQVLTSDGDGTFSWVSQSALTPSANLVTGTTLKSTVVSSSLQSVGTLATAHIQGAQAYASSATNLATTVSKKALRVQGSSNASVSLWMGALANDAQQYIQACNDAGDGADDIVLNPFGGKVGIGIGNASPNTTLTLSDGTDEFDFGVTTNQLMIKSVTSDGSDDQRIIIDAGNGGQSSTRGAYIALSGNEASSEAGKAIYQTGNVSGSSHVFRISGGSDALTIDSSGNATFAGTVFVPEYIKHDGDTNTSLRFLSDRIILNAGGNNAIDIGTSEIAINHDQANIDFRVESDTNDHALFVDAGVSCVSINRSSSYGNAPLHIVGEGDVDSMGYPQLILEGDTHDYPGILFRGGSGTHGAMRIEGGDGFSFWTTDHSSISWNNRLRIEEDGTFTGSSSADISDRNLKKNIKSISNGLETIKKLQGRTFEWKKSSNMAEGVKYGLIAQELEEVLPDLVYDKSGIVEKEDGTFYKSVFMGGVIPVLIEAVKELSDKLDTSNAKITALENA